MQRELFCAGLALAALMALGCATETARQEASLAPVSAAPPGCAALSARLEGHPSLAARQWLDGPEQSAEARRLRALAARAAELGCTSPQG